MISDSVRYTAGAMALLVVGTIATCYLQNGFLEFALDDPYIHLALAENLIKLHYGHNLGEFSSPSSSLLFPYLLVPGLLLGGPIVWAVAVNATFTILSACLLSASLDQLTNGASGKGRSFVHSILSCSVIVGANGLSLILYGMEHSLHLLGVVLWVVGIVELVERNRVGLLFYGALLSMLVRYDALPAFIVALCLMVYCGRFKAAATLFLATAIFYGGHALLFLSLNLDPVPGSILTKLRGSGGSIRSRVICVWQFISNRDGAVFLGPLVLSMLMLIYSTWVRARPKKMPAGLFLAWLSVAATCSAYLLVAVDLGFNGRYEAASLCALLTLLACTCASLSQRELAIGSGLILLVALTTSQRAVINLADLPLACKQTRQQQVAIGNLARSWALPVAVNVPGTASYQNDAYVLDLVGLGNQEVRKALELDQPNILTAFTRIHEIGLAMIYPHWYPNQIPPDWKLVGWLTLPDRRVVSPPSRSVSIYITDPKAAQPALEAVKSWASSGVEGFSWNDAP